MRKPQLHLKRLLCSKKALALPVTFLILLVSTLGIIAVTYYFAVERVNSQATALKVSTSKQNMLSINQAVTNTFWQPGSAATFEVTDSGGMLHLEPTNNTLNVSIKAAGEIDQTIYKAPVGRVIYELPYTGAVNIGFYLKGDERTVVNQSGSSMAQMVIANGEEHVELQLRYRPSVTYVTAGEENGRAVNNIRIYIVNLNSSDRFALFGVLPLQARCLNSQLTTKSYQVTQAVTAVTVTSTLDGQAGSVTVPITTLAGGADINIETVVCNVAIERWIR